MAGKKELGYRLFALNYRIASHFSVRGDSVFSVMTHDASETGNVRTMEQYAAEHGVFCFTHYGREQKDGLSSGNPGKILDFFFRKPWQMARARYILMDNEFLPLSYLRVRRETKVVQLWHGTGTIKKFGQDVNEGRLKELERRANENIDLLPVSHEKWRSIYAGAFGIPESKVCVTGLPRTDALLRAAREDTEGARERVLAYLKGQQTTLPASIRSFYLYAPTFRDNETAAPRLHLDLGKLTALLPESMTILVRLHPEVAKRWREQKVGDTEGAAKADGRILDVSAYPSLTDLFLASDGLITDFSSIMYDYAVLGKPVFFAADDMEHFLKEDRGVYLPYGEDLPGMICHDEKELAEAIAGETAGAVSGSAKDETALTSQAKREAFLEANYAFLDGNACARIWEWMRR